MDKQKTEKSHCHFTREEMLAELDEGYDPLEVSIHKWEAILTCLIKRDIHGAYRTENGWYNCALCHVHNTVLGGSCGECPIALSSGELCEGTPYQLFSITLQTLYFHAEELEAKEVLKTLSKLRTWAKTMLKQMKSLLKIGGTLGVRVNGVPIGIPNQNKDIFEEVSFNHERQ